MLPLPLHGSRGQARSRPRREEGPARLGQVRPVPRNDQQGHQLCSEHTLLLLVPAFPARGPSSGVLAGQDQAGHDHQGPYGKEGKGGQGQPCGSRRKRSERACAADSRRSDAQRSGWSGRSRRSRCSDDPPSSRPFLDLFSRSQERNDRRSLQGSEAQARFRGGSFEASGQGSEQEEGGPDVVGFVGFGWCRWVSTTLNPIPSLSPNDLSSHPGSDYEPKRTSGRKKQRTVVEAGANNGAPSAPRTAAPATRRQPSRRANTLQGD